MIFEKHELKYFVIVSKHIIAYKKQHTIKIKAYLFVFHVSQNNIIFRNKHLEKQIFRKILKTKSWIRNTILTFSKSCIALQTEYFNTNYVKAPI